MKGISIKRFECYLLYLLSIHVAALFIFFIFRFTLFCSIDYQFPAEIKGDVLLQSGAFLRGLWFDNVIACYILLLPLAVLWIAALCIEQKLLSYSYLIPNQSLLNEQSIIEVD